MKKTIIIFLLGIIFTLSISAQPVPTEALGVISATNETTISRANPVSGNRFRTFSFELLVNTKLTFSVSGDGTGFSSVLYRNQQPAPIANNGGSSGAVITIDLNPGQYIAHGTVSKDSFLSTTLNFKPETSIIPDPGLNLSSSQNYIHTRTYTNEAGTAYMDQVQYFDGLGRPVQTVQKAITPGVDVSARKDLVTLQQYDNFGRESKSWLPAAMANNNGAYADTLSIMNASKTTNANSGTADQKPYSYPVYEASPLNRIVKQFGPGADWQNTVNEKAVLTAYTTNIAGNAILNCKLYLVTGTSQSPTLSQTTNYATGQLYVTELKDEDGNTSYEFKDKLGQVVLTRQMDGTTPLDTYYVYDDFGNQCYVLPPRIQDEGIAQTKLNELAYQYRYDNRNRCIWKKIPGCEPIRYVYDKADRLVYTQDGVQYNKSPKEWTFTIPDAFGRVVLTGICKDTIPVSNKVVKGVYASTGSYKRYNIQVDGVNKTFTNTPSILSVNFYDNYDFRGMAEIPASGTEYNPETGYGTWYGTDYTDANKYKNKGLLTGSMTAQMNADGTTGSTYLYSVMYYNNKKQLVQTKGNNHLAGGIEKEYIAYNFTGQPTQRKHVHQVTGKNTQTEVYAYTYDHAGRLLTTTHQLTDGTTVKPQVTLAENSYDDLGRLKTNKKGGQTNLNTTYAYNVRSWTNSIANAHFNEALTYSYNGNISSTQWGQAGKTRKYTFTYDNLSRLKTAAYTGESPTNFAASYSYDKHGNIKTLQRYGMTTASAYGIIDNLTAEYTGNQLKYVSDAVGNFALNSSMDFKEYTEGTNTEYFYNLNGAMYKDLNKGISAITYNSLNLPQMVDIKNQSVEGRNEYTYSASGQKLKAVQKWNPNYYSAPVIGSDINVSSLTMSTTTDYVGNVIYENGTLKRILVDGGYYEGGNYYFYINDHLGNNRIVANATASVVQSTQYYPFGMPFADATGQDVQPYKYNNKELDGRNGLNMYDYSARYYESALGRFTSVDPLAEKYYSISPYAYVGNNPINAIDINGDSITVTHRTGFFSFLGIGKKETVTYENGNLYNRDGTAYTGKVKGFLSKAVNALDNLRNTEEGNALVSELQSSTHIFDIQKGSSNTFSPNSTARASGNLSLPGSSLGSGGIIKWNPDSTSGAIDITGSTSRPAYIGLGHELIHGSDSNQGILDYSMKDGIYMAEWNAVYRENLIRGQANIPLRSNYGLDISTGKPVGTGPNLFKDYLKRQNKRAGYPF